MGQQESVLGQSAAPLGAVPSPAGTFPGYKHSCEICGCAAMLPVDLAEKGLEYRCSFLGLPCGSSSSRHGASPRFLGGVAAATPPHLDNNADAAVNMEVPSDDDSI